MSLLAENTRRWNEMTVKPGWLDKARPFARMAVNYKAVYQQIASEIQREYGQHIPWWFIPMVHERECLRGVNNWDCNIAQGCRYNVKCGIIPPNGPFSSFKEAAIDALVHQAPRAATNMNWSGGGAMTMLERYNGLGYAKKGRPSPYVWSGTTAYVRGKYVADKKYDPNKVDTQIGTAILLKALMEADPSIVLDAPVPGQDQTDHSKEITTGGVGGGTIATTAHQAALSGVDITIIASIVIVAVLALGWYVYRTYQKKKAEV